MRDFKGMKRQRGRNRGGGSSGGNLKPTQNANRAFDSNGPEGVKVRGNPQHVFEKYQQLARDANAAGDRVLGENYLQHAEHYFRLLRAIQPNRPASEILGRDHFSSGYDIDFEDETGQAQALAADEAATAAGEPAEDAEPREQVRPRNDWQPREDRQRDDRPREDRQRDERPRDDRPRDDRPRNDGGGNRDRYGRDNNRDRNRNRDDRPRDDRPRDERPRDERSREDRPRDDRPRDDRPRDDRPRSDAPRAEGDEPRRDRQDRPERVEREAPIASQPLAPEPGESRGGAMLRDSDGGASHAPAFLQARAAPAPTVDAEIEKPARVRRRKPKSFEAGDGPGTSDPEGA